MSWVFGGTVRTYTAAPPETRLHSLSVQALWLQPKAWFSYHDIMDVARLHPILVEPVHYYDDPDDTSGEPI